MKGHTTTLPPTTTIQDVRKIINTNFINHYVMVFSQKREHMYNKCCTKTLKQVTVTKDKHLSNEWKLFLSLPIHVLTWIQCEAMEKNQSIF